MINLSSLSALLRTLRHTSGVEGPAAEVARVASVTPVAGDDAGAMTSTALRPALWTRPRSPLDALDVDAAAGNDDAHQATAATLVRPAAHQGVAAVAGAPQEAIESMSLAFTAGARLLQSVLRGTALKTPAPPTIASQAPLAPDRATPVPVLARALASALAESGLFYESHLARALQRDYPMAALAREPQSGWPMVPDANPTNASAPAPALPEAAAALLNRQLDLLDTRTLVWSGEIWPGQRAQIAFDEAQSGAEPEEDDIEGPKRPAAWRTRITLDLPSLGRVDATLNVVGGTLGLSLVAERAEIVERLADAKAGLDHALTESRLALVGFAVGEKA